MAMNNWCPNGCQDLCGLGECGMCGYEGDGVDYWKTTYEIVEDFSQPGRYVRALRSPGFCFECGEDLVDGRCNECDRTLEVNPPIVGFLMGFIAGLRGK